MYDGGKKKDKSKIKCFKCEKIGHHARECTEQTKEVSFHYYSLHNVFVSSFVLLAKADSIWIVDSSIIDHITKERGAFIEYHQIPRDTRWIYVGNKLCVSILGIGSCKLTM